MGRGICLSLQMFCFVFSWEPMSCCYTQLFVSGLGISTLCFNLKVLLFHFGQTHLFL